MTSSELNPGCLTVSLNRSELAYAALDGLVGTIGQIFTLRFAREHSVAELKAAVRDLVRRYPRLRGVVERTTMGHRLRILPDDAHVDVLFEDAFRVVAGAGVDRASIERFVGELSNDPFPIERGLLVRARLLTGGPGSVLVLVVHHIVCDGRGAYDLLDSLMASLHGEEGPPASIDDPSMIPAILPSSWLARVTHVLRSYRLERADRRRFEGLRPIDVATPRPVFGPSKVFLHVMGLEFSEIRRCARERSCTVTELMMAVLAKAFASAHEEDGHNAVTVRASVDLRPYFAAERRPLFGNYVAPVVIRLPRWNDVDACIDDARAQLRESLRRLESRELGYPLLMAELLPRVGRRLFAAAVRNKKRDGTLPVFTFHYSNLGSYDPLNRHGSHAELVEAFAAVPSFGFFIGVSGIAGKLCIAIAYPREEMPRAELDAVFARAEAILAELSAPSAAAGVAERTAV